MSGNGAMINSLSYARQGDKQNSPFFEDYLVRLLEEVAREQGIRARTLPSGGGHDCQIMARRCDAAMIFVPSRDGRSHTPDEYTAPDEMAAAVQTLAAALHRLAY